MKQTIVIRELSNRKTSCTGAFKGSSLFIYHELRTDILYQNIRAMCKYVYEALVDVIKLRNL